MFTQFLPNRAQGRIYKMSCDFLPAEYYFVKIASSILLLIYTSELL